MNPTLQSALAKARLGTPTSPVTLSAPEMDALNAGIVQATHEQTRSYGQTCRLILTGALTIIESNGKLSITN